MADLERRSEVVEGYLRTAPPASSLPWRQASFAVLGLEAIGPEPRRDQLASIACVPVEQGKAIMGKAFEATIGPGGVALEPIVEALTGRVLVAHSASRHTGFLSAVFERAGLGCAAKYSIPPCWPRGCRHARPQKVIGPGRPRTSRRGSRKRRRRSASRFTARTRRAGRPSRPLSCSWHLRASSTAYTPSPSARSPGCAPKTGIATGEPLGKASSGGGTPSIALIGA